MVVADFVLFIAILLGVVSAIGVAFLPNILHAAVSLIFTLLSVAIVYGVLGADFMAAVQLIIYVGATIVVIIFAIMMTPDLNQKRLIDNLPRYIVPAILGVLLFIPLWYFISNFDFSIVELNAPASQHTTALVGYSLMGPYSLVFEYVAIVLLFGLVGAVVIARKGSGEQ